MNVGTRMGTKQSAFTIVETMIVVAVTGALFVVIASTFAGRQNEAEFIHAINDTQAKIQKVINQSVEGFYSVQNIANNTNNFTCSSVPGSAPVFTPGSKNLGANETCVILGDVLQLSVHGTSPEQYRVYPVADSAYSSITTATSPFSTAFPTLVNVAGAYAPYSVSGTLEYGLTTLWIHADGINNIGGVAFLMESGTQNVSSDNGYVSGTQQIDLVPLVHPGLNQPVVTPAAASSIQSDIQAASSIGPAPRMNPDTGVQICFVSGTTNQSGLMLIGGHGRELSVDLTIKSNPTCS